MDEVAGTLACRPRRAGRRLNDSDPAMHEAVLPQAIELVAPVRGVTRDAEQVARTGDLFHVSEEAGVLKSGGTEMEGFRGAFRKGWCGGSRRGRRSW